MDIYEQLLARCPAERKTENHCRGAHQMDPCGHAGPCPCQYWYPTEGFEDTLHSEWHIEKDEQIKELGRLRECENRQTAEQITRAREATKRADAALLARDEAIRRAQVAEARAQELEKLADDRNDAGNSLLMDNLILKAEIAGLNERLEACAAEDKGLV